MGFDWASFAAGLVGALVGSGTTIGTAFVARVALRKGARFTAVESVSAHAGAIVAARSDPAIADKHRFNVAMIRHGEAVRSLIQLADFIPKKRLPVVMNWMIAVIDDLPRMDLRTVDMHQAANAFALNLVKWHSGEVGWKVFDNPMISEHAHREGDNPSDHVPQAPMSMGRVRLQRVKQRRKRIAPPSAKITGDEDNQR